MTIMSWKNAESEELEKLKARIVFRGQCENGRGWVRPILGDKGDSNYNSWDQNQLGFWDETWTLYHTIGRSQSLYIQSDLSTLVPTYVELPWELTPEHLRHLHRPRARLWKSLCGHPESGGHWAHKFADVIAAPRGVEPKDFSQQHHNAQVGFAWNIVRGWHVKRASGQPCQILEGTWETFEAWRAATGQPSVGRESHRKRRCCRISHGRFHSGMLQQVPWDDRWKGFQESSDALSWGIYTLPLDDYDVQGALQHCAEKLIMKAYIDWLARLNRPDVLRALNELSRRITKWSRNDDRKLHRVMAYLHFTKRFRMKCKLDPDSPCKLMLFKDADHSSSAEPPCTPPLDHC